MAANTARKLNTVPAKEYEKRLRVIEGNRRRKRIERIRGGLFLGTAIGILCVTIVYYLSLQAEITNSIKEISKQESRLNELKLDNDENYSRITSNVNLEEIRRIAIQELGMQYAGEGQIVTFNGEGADYLRQTGEIPH